MTTVDDLAEVYEAAVSKRYMEWVNGPEGDNISNDMLRRAGIRAVVMALRNHFQYGNGWPGASTWKEFDEILASEGEKVVGGQRAPVGSTVVLKTPTTDPAPTVGQRLIKAAKEAAAIARGEDTDAAPAVCVWTLETHPDDGSHYETACGDAWCSVLGGTPKQDNYSFCPSCGKPIAFTEAK